MNTATEAPTATLGQTDVWVDRQGVRHDVAAMSVRYKSNVVAFLERRAVMIVARAMVDSYARTIYGSGRVMPCVIAEDNGVPIECGATDEWAHGVWHGTGPMPGSEAFDLFAEDNGDALFDAMRAIDSDEAVERVRSTPLVARMLDDIANNRGGEDD